MKKIYDDIINLPHPTSLNHPRMPIADRAAQFAPFAALTGYDDAVKEAARLTEKKRELDEDQKAQLDLRLRLLLNQLPEMPYISLTYFLPDEKKDGGIYVTVHGRLHKYDSLQKVIVLENGNRIPIENICDIE